VLNGVERKNHLAWSNKNKNKNIEQGKPVTEEETNRNAMLHKHSLYFPFLSSNPQNTLFSHNKTFGHSTTTTANPTRATNFSRC